VPAALERSVFAMKNLQFSGILGQNRLHFQDNQELEAYYTTKYGAGGYAEGFTAHGINISELYHRARQESAYRFLRPEATDIILDTGCGEGTLSARIAAECRTVHAIDIAGNALAARRRSIANLVFQKMNIEALAFADAFFDKIVCVETLEHVIDPRKAIAELHRVLKPGGRLVVSYPTNNRTTMQRLRLARRVEISEHLTEWSYDEVVARVTAAGFVLEDAEGLVFDFGVFGYLRYTCRFLTDKITRLSLKIRSFPRNSAFPAFSFRKLVPER
jgi:2-polyprenyl-3-methyl-5-hydroxy-6-metoxy-1,4-benzoquinol methylase